MEESRSRLRIFVALIAVMLGILALRIGKLQIVERSDHTGQSAANAVREWRVQPPRGRFYDRNGVLLVDNECDQRDACWRDFVGCTAVVHRPDQLVGKM